MNRTLKSRLLVGLLVSLGILLVVACGLLNALQRELLYRDFDRRLHMAFPAVLRQLAAQSFQGPSMAGQAIPGIACYLAQHPETGATILHYRPDLLDTMPLEREPFPGEVSAIDFTFQDGRPARALMEFCEIPPLPDTTASLELSSFPKALVICLADQTTDLHASLRTRALAIGLGGLVAMVWIATTVIWVVHRTLRPLQPLGQHIAALQVDALDSSIHIPGLPGEIIPLVERLNELLQRLDEGFQREKAFTANAAHELLTPVSGIRSTLEVTLHRERSSHEYVQALENCLGVVTGLERLVDNLLELSRLDSGQLIPIEETVEMWCVTERQWNIVCERAQQRNLRFINRLPEGLTCRVDATLMDRVMANLLDNASRYTDLNGTIEVSGEAHEGMLCITVTNSACDLTPDDVPRLFDRFWEKDSARSQTGLHLGLGLSLVRRYLEVMGGSIRAELTDNQQLAMRFEIPG